MTLQTGRSNTENENFATHRILLFEYHQSYLLMKAKRILDMYLVYGMMKYYMQCYESRLIQI